MTAKTNSALTSRDDAIRRIEELRRTGMSQEEARKAWKQETNYHQRSKAETAMFRYKTTFGEKLLARLLPNQKTEASIKVAILNIFANLGLSNAKPKVA